MANEMFTQLPTVTNASPSDIICAVQGYVSPSVPGISVQETLAQILALSSQTLIQNFAGNPNGHVAGTIYNLCWDTADSILWVCTSSGSASTAIWTKANAGDGAFIWNHVTTASQSMVINNGYVIDDSSSLVTLTLPSVSAIGNEIDIVGRSSSGWSIVYGSGQYIKIGTSTSTTTSGSVSSTNATDSLTLICTAANTEWTSLSVISAGLTIV